MVLSMTTNFQSYMRNLDEEYDMFLLKQMNVWAELSKTFTVKFYPKNISESLPEDRKQKKMKYRVISQILHSFNFQHSWLYLGVMHLSMSSRQGEAGHRAGFD